MLESHATTSEFLHRLFLEHHLDLVPSIEISSNDLLIDLAKIGLGIAFIPDFCLSDMGEEIIAINLKTELPKRQLVAAYSDHFPLTDATEQFLQSLLEE